LVDRGDPGNWTVRDPEFVEGEPDMRTPRRLSVAVALALAGGGLAATVPAGTAAAAPLTAVLVRTVDTSAWPTPSPDPAGITYDAAANRLVLSDSEVDEMPLYQGRNVFYSTLDGRQSAGAEGWTTVPWSYEPAGITYQSPGRFLVSDDDQDQVFLVDTGPDGTWTPEDGVPQSFTTRPVDGDPEDVTMDMDATTNGHVLVIDGHGTDVYDYGPGPDGAWNGLAPAGDDTRVAFDVGQYGALDPEGIEYHPARNTVLVLDSGSEAIYELDRQGRLINVVSIAAGSPKSAAGMTLAPPSDGSAGLNLYIVDRGVDNDTNPAENDGRFYEMAVDLPPLGTTTNRAPTANAGPDLAVNQSTSVSLSGTVGDDGLPDPGGLTVGWSTASGPGTVTFANPGAASTTATFSAAGAYVLRLTAGDGDMSASDLVSVQVSEAPPNGAVAVDVAGGTGADDAEERSASTSVTGSDLELMVDGTTVQTVGLRFPGLPVPPGATVTEAHLQFSVDEASTAPTSLRVAGQAADDPPAFGPERGNVSTRPRTAAAVDWAPAGWPDRGARGVDQRAVGLAPVLQEIVARPGWAAGNAVVLVVTGNGSRTAAAWEAGQAKRPVLHVEFLPGGAGEPVNAPPEVSAGADVTVALPGPASLAGSLADDGLPAPPGAATAAWTAVSGPGAVAFADGTAPATTAMFETAGTYVLRLTGTDGVLQTSDDVTVTVTEPPPPPPPPTTGVLDVPVAAGTDDAEERSASVSLTGTDLELVVDGTTLQTVGLRFAGVAVPPGATIMQAFVQFTVDEATTTPAALTVAGQAADAPPGFSAVSKDVSARPRTAARVGWTPDAWPVRGERGPAQRTPDLSSVVQEIVSRPGWAQGNPVVLVVTGSGARVAAAFERGAAKAAVLHVEFRM
jgi:hypothetical protein